MRESPSLPVLFFVWTAIAVLSFTRHYLQQAETNVPIGFWSGIPVWLACYYTWIPLTPLVFRVEKTFRVSRPSWLQSASVLAVASVLFSYAACVLSGFSGVVLGKLQNRPIPTLRAIWAPPLGEFCIEQFVFWSVFAAAFFLRKLRELGEQQRETARILIEKARLETSLRQVELDVLRMRLNPHFLFNALQNISALARPDPATASRMLTRLGDLLRSAFRRDFQSEVTLETEMALTRGYIDIEKMRFDDRLRVETTIAPGTERALVPSLLLQPVVENAIIHGLAGISKRGEIRVESTVEDEVLILTVSDNGAGAPPGEFELGVGLGSLRERLARMYPGAHTIDVNRPSHGGTEVRISFPFRTALNTTVSANDQLALVDR